MNKDAKATELLGNYKGMYQLIKEISKINRSMRGKKQTEEKRKG